MCILWLELSVHVTLATAGTATSAASCRKMGVGIAHAHAPLLTFAPLHVNDDGSKLRKPTVGGRCWRRCSEGFEAGKSCVFQAMKEDHIVRLLQCSGMTVGGHALLWELWERDSSPCSRPNRKFFLQHCITVLHVALLRKQRRYSSTRSITIFCVVVFIFSSYV